ncbi:MULTISPECIES: glycosyl hydrolase [unclassified Fibrobacter]|uniref:glycosyl hydrolase n=1 Tax=unclassified Fibrobacter TaxID=2634177 RepID=UPI000D6ACCC4|nr:MULTISPECIES: glycosyl hydrolase [unclassified Fibrobacter]PWJ61737.1 carbohydrate-binding protein with CBM35 doain [Fibrobacter sp. UWR4]PZW67393.1 carbohydrate-binding protein with CBM35 doain [Fibrobacter sp. UWR1]
MITMKIVLSFGLAAAVTASAVQYEAESATLGGTAKAVSSAGASGTGYADLQEGSITFANVQAEKAGKYSVKIHYKAGDYKANYIVVNGATSGSVDFNAAANWTDVEAVVTLKAGTNSIAIEKYWGWISVDYIDVSPYQSAAFDISADPITPNATASAKKLYSFLRENFGKKTISGIMTGDMSGYTKGADFRTHEDPKDIFTRSGKYPALVGVDFLFATGPKASESWYTEYTEKGISLAKDLWERGGIPAFTWHWKDPLDQKDAFYIQSAAGSNEYTDFDFSTGFKPGTTEWNTESAAYKGIIDDIDHIADYFLELQEAGVAGIFRPLHEAGGKWFWWSINSGDQFAALYRLVFDRMVKVKGVRNMIWVYNPENSTVTSWDPGSEYYDILSIDIYNKANDNSSNAGAFEKFKTASGAKKIIALSENGPIPDVNNMHADEAVWSWWMPWYGSWSGTWPGETSNALWKSNMADERIITLEDMPGWGTYTPSTGDSPLRLTKDLEFNGSSQITGVYNLKGHYMGTESSMSKLPQGRYIVRSQKDGKTNSSLYIKK